jgi:CHAD domain-containing protein
LPPPLSTTDTLQDGLRLMLDEGLDHLATHLPAARAGDMEGIHQMRVALRRLRSTLRLLRRHLEPVAADGFDDALRQLGRTLGAARDWDVFVGETLPAIRAADPDGGDALDTLLGPAQQARDAAHAALKTVLEAPLNEAVLADLRIWAGASVAFFPDAEANRNLARQAPHMLDRLAKRVRRRGRKLGHQDDEERHDLRKALKALRYGVQMLETLYDKDDTKRFRKALGGLQEDLGQLNDAIAAVTLARRLPDLPGREVVERWSDSRRQAALEALPASWHRFKAIKVFW